jgi:two-component system cell cycle response regulator
MKKFDNRRMRNLFIIDDSTVNLKMLEAALAGEGYQLTPFTDPTVALREAYASPPDLILTDIVMPKLTGIALIDALKSDPSTSLVPVIAVSSLTEVSDVKNALDRGAFDYIKKPFEELEVKARVRSALRYKENQDKLREASKRDSLTGLLNHMSFVSRLAEELDRALAESYPLAFLMVDIDRFKTVNDRLGHQAGDFVLAKVADLMRMTCSASGEAGRYGGEEFGIVLRQYTADMAMKQAEALRKAIGTMNAEYQGKSVFITVSIGISASQGLVQGMTRELIRRADEALYKAKSEGRNRSVLFS